MSYGKLTTAISLLTFLLSVFFLFHRGLNLSVEFTGGTLMEVEFSTPADTNAIRQVLVQDKLEQGSVQTFGSTRDVMIRLPNSKNMNSGDLSNLVLGQLKTLDSTVVLKNNQYIGPQVGQELVNNGLLAIAFVCIGIMVYLAMRFEWRFAVSAIIANMHDVVIILGFFAFFQWEFSLTVLAAILAVLGYSVNESVVVFDRIRENFKNSRDNDVSSIINNAITTTMSRTIITHGCTEMMVLSMFFFGGQSLHYFSLALTIGILFGIYSSVLVASPIVMWLGVSKTNMVKIKKKKEDIIV